MYLKEIVHADVKPQNIVIFQWGCKAMNARLSDFSLSRSTKNHQVRLEEGTTVYSCLHRPVEVWLNYRKEAGNYSKHLEFKRCKSVQLDSGGFRASGWGWEDTGRLGDYSGSLAIRIPAQMVLNGNADLSAFGATAFELLSGRFLFPHNEEKMLSLVQAQGPPVKVFNMYDESVASAVKRSCMFPAGRDNASAALLVTSTVASHERGVSFVMLCTSWQGQMCSRASHSDCDTGQLPAGKCRTVSDRMTLALFPALCQSLCAISALPPPTPAPTPPPPHPAPNKTRKT